MKKLRMFLLYVINKYKICVNKQKDADYAYEWFENWQKAIKIHVKENPLEKPTIENMKLFIDKQSKENEEK